MNAAPDIHFPSHQNYKQYGEVTSNFYKTERFEWRGGVSRPHRINRNRPYVMLPYQNATDFFPIIANAARFAASLP
ncbi:MULTISPECIES: hypothetical protein [unclassified Cupriavidus]|uniref:hypothetical protein n=1 Tax=Cupriavidus sp. H19C3 TaxID=3241603 RepID=UPI0011DC55E9|nr:MAG: hypothetical protein E6Q40_03295 [Cupriavidus sp.]